MATKDNTAEAVTTTDDLRTINEGEPTSTTSTNLTSPTGSKVTASPDAAKKLRAAGWKSSK